MGLWEGLCNLAEIVVVDIPSKTIENIKGTIIEGENQLENLTNDTR